MDAPVVQTLDDLLILLPGLRRMRSMNADLLRTLLNRQDGECTWCGAEIGKYRRAWCSDRCVEAFKARCCQNTVRGLVEERDRGVCQVCGRDTLAAEREAKRLKLYPSWPRSRRARRSRRHGPAQLEALREFGYARGEWRAVDHREPVAEGGGLCPAHELRLLCGVCHERVTLELIARQKAARKQRRDKKSA